MWPADQVMTAWCLPVCAVRLCVIPFSNVALNQACEQLGIPRLTPHELR
jgi:hypothetical protein